MTAQVKRFVVKVIEYATEKVVQTSRPMSERQADRVDRGMNRNLDHDRYFTLVEPAGA